MFELTDSTATSRTNLRAESTGGRSGKAFNSSVSLGNSLACGYSEVGSTSAPLVAGGGDNFADAGSASPENENGCGAFSDSKPMRSCRGSGFNEKACGSERFA